MFEKSLVGNLRAGSAAIGLAGLLALGACDKGPDQATVAAQLKGDVEAQLKTMEASTAPRTITHTAVTVTPVDKERYQIAIEGLKFQPSPEGYLDIGTLSYVAKPKDEQTYEVSDLKIAPEIPFKGADGKEKGKLALTTKSFQGLWSRDLATLVKAEGEFADIVATDTEGADLRIANFKFGGELKDKGGGLYDSAGSGTIANFAIKESASDGLFSIKDMQVNASYEGIKLKEYQAAAMKYQELLAKQMAAVEGGQAAALTPEEAKALADAVATMAATVKGGEGKFVFNGTSYTEAGATPFALETLSLSSRLDGINEEKASFNFDLGHKGLAINAPEASGALAKGILPKDGNLGLKVTDIPSKELVKVLADNLPGMMAADSTMAEANAMAMLVALQAVLQTSGAKIEVTPSALTADVTEVKADGNFSVSPQAMMGIAGALNIAWTGLDEVMALAQANSAEPNAMDVTSAVGMLMSLAKRETGADGKPVDKFLIEVKETGEFTVNGNPM